MDEKIYLRDLNNFIFTKDEFIDYYNRCMLFGLTVCVDAEFKIGKFKNISCGLFRVEDEEVRIPDFVSEIYCNNQYRGNLCIKRLDLNKVTTICSNGLQNCYKLESVLAPNVKTIGSYAFYYCSSLKGLDAPKLKYLGECAFSSCSKFSFFSSERLEKINEYTFNGTSLKELNTPNLREIRNIGRINDINSSDDTFKAVILNGSDRIEVHYPKGNFFFGNYKTSEIVDLDIDSTYFYKKSIQIMDKTSVLEDKVRF